jgi:two-component system NtrC family sensor kinase
MGLSLKLALCLLASSAFLFGLFGYLNTRLQRRQSEQLVMESAERVSDLIGRSTHYLMLRNDREALYRVITTMGSEPGIRKVRILNEEGRIDFSTDPGEVGRLVDKDAEVCTGCHAGEAPRSSIDRSKRARIFTDREGERVLGVIRPVENAPECWSASCHVHERERRILGVIDADLSLARVDEQLAVHQRQLVRFTAGAMLLFAFVSVGFVWGVVHRPVSELIAGAHRVAGGDLSRRIAVRSGDELGELAAAFNTMTADLGSARAEITDWARTLEERVDRKTRELEGAQAHLLAAERMAALGKLAATVAHEVNNPLMGVLTYARLTLKSLGAGSPDPAAREEMTANLRIIERESRRCGDIIRNLLTFARQTPSHREPSDVNILVERSLALVRHRLELTGVVLEKRLDESLPSVLCDPGQIQQVVLALLVNAVEAMPRGGRLEVATERAPREGVAITVRDDGAGIPADLLPRISEPFFTTKEGDQRTGLGLAVAQSIVERHAGTISVRSAPGKGTEFIVRLPLASPAGGGERPDVDAGEVERTP